MLSKNKQKTNKKLEIRKSDRSKDLEYQNVAIQQIYLPLIREKIHNTTPGKERGRERG